MNMHIRPNEYHKIFTLHLVIISLLPGSSGFNDLTICNEHKLYFSCLQMNLIFFRTLMQ